MKLSSGFFPIIIVVNDSNISSLISLFNHNVIVTFLVI